MSHLIQIAVNTVCSVIILCGLNSSISSNSGSSYQNLILETKIIENTLIELREISKIQSKITSINRKIDQLLAHTIAESVYRNCKEANKDPDMILSIMAIESYFNPEAQSPAGARGLMQIMPFWAKEFGIKINDLYDVNTNIKIGIKILTSYERLYKQYDLVLTTYNKGPILVRRDLKNGINPRTGYSSMIIKTYRQLKKIEFDSIDYITMRYGGDASVNGGGITNTSVPPNQSIALGNRFVN